jgi:hypothetical protein
MLMVDQELCILFMDTNTNKKRLGNRGNNDISFHFVLIVLD